MPNRELMPWGGPRGLNPFGSLRREMERLFDDFLPPGFSHRASGSWPSLDVSETEHAYTISAELPGMEQKDIEIDLRENMLTISGEKRQERKEEKGGRTYAECHYGRFERSVPFDAEIDGEKAEASFDKGVLTVTLPKSAKAAEKSRKISIKAH